MRSVMPHPLAFLINFKKDPDPGQLNPAENKAEVAKRGEPWEMYVKDQLAGTRGANEEKRQKIWEEVFLYQGAIRNPPDKMTVHSGGEIKKMNKYAPFQLNSSNREKFLNPKNEKFTDEGRMIAEKISDDFYKKNKAPVPFYYYIVNMNTRTARIEGIYIVDGMCLEEIEEGIRPVFKLGMNVKEVYERGNPEEILALKKMGLVEGAEHVSRLGKKGKYMTDTNEIAVYKTKGSMQRARQMGALMHPAATYKEMLPPRPKKKRNEENKEVRLAIILTKKNYLLMPDECRKEVEAEEGVAFKEFKQNNEDCMVICCERKIK